MRTQRDDTPDEDVLTVSGVVRPQDAGRLAAETLDAVNAHDDRRDVLLDAHGMTEFSPGASWALVRARSRAKWLRRRLVVLDSDDGVLARHIRSHGHQKQLPVYADAAAARAGLLEAREALASRAGAFGRAGS